MTLGPLCIHRWVDGPFTGQFHAHTLAAIHERICQHCAERERDRIAAHAERVPVQKPPYPLVDWPTLRCDCWRCGEAEGR